MNESLLQLKTFLTERNVEFSEVHNKDNSTYKISTNGGVSENINGAMNQPWIKDFKVFGSIRKGSDEVFTQFYTRIPKDKCVFARVMMYKDECDTLISDLQFSAEWWEEREDEPEKKQYPDCRFFHIWYECASRIFNLGNRVGFLNGTRKYQTKTKI